MFRATMCPSSGADDCVMLLASCWYVPWLQEGGQDRLAGIASIGRTTCQSSALDDGHMVTRNMLSNY